MDELHLSLLKQGAAVAAAAWDLPPPAQAVKSLLLERTIRLAPSYGRAELSFLGSGRV